MILILALLVGAAAGILSAVPLALVALWVSGKRRGAA